MGHEDLVKLINEKGYGLFKILNGTAPSFDEMQKEGPVDSLEIGGCTYLFIPTPSKGQTLRESYSQTKGFGPSLIINPSYNGLIDFYKGSHTYEKENEIFFSRLALVEDGTTVLMTPKTKFIPNPSGVLLDTPLLFEIFSNNFRIVTPEKYGRVSPIPYPQDVKNN